MKFKLIQHLFVKNSCARFLANLADGLVTDTRSWIEGRMLSPQCYFLCRKEHLKSYLCTGIKVTFCLLIIFIGISGRCVFFIFYC
jgi:hypothetical protein